MKEQRELSEDAVSVNIEYNNGERQSILLTTADVGMVLGVQRKVYRAKDGANDSEVIPQGTRVEVMIAGDYSALNFDFDAAVIGDLIDVTVGSQKFLDGTEATHHVVDVDPRIELIAN